MVIILGLGFSGQRLARRLLWRGDRVCAAVRGVARFRDLAEAGLTLVELESAVPVLPKNAVLVHLIPPLPEPENTALRATIEELEPRRVVYISSTGVYGERVNIDAETAVEPGDERGRRRFEEERWVAAHSWSSLILRAAAIYGPGRGVHAAIREGKLPRGAGAGVVSRIHVEDLAAIIEAGTDCDLEGAWPVADDEPCSTAEIAAWCAERFEIDNPLVIDRSIAYKSIAERSIAGRRVNGAKIREKLGIVLQYFSWRTGIPASIEEEEKLSR